MNESDGAANSDTGHPARGGPRRPPVSALEEITIRSLYHLVRRRWKVMLVTLLVTLGAVAYVTFEVFSPLYESTAVVLIKPGREFAYGSDLGERLGLPDRLDGIVMAELEILHSEDLLLDAVGVIGPGYLYPDLDGDPYAAGLATRRFREQLSASVVPGADVIRISFRHRDPAIAAEAVNLLVERFRDHHLKAFGDAQTLDFLDGRVGEFNQDLEQAEEKLREYQQAHPPVTLNNPAQEMERLRAQIDLNLKQVRNDVSALYQQVKYLKEHESSLPRTSALRESIALEIISAEAEVRGQRARRRGLTGQLEELEAELHALPGHLRDYRVLLRVRDAAARRHRIYSERREEAQVNEEMNRARIANISIIQQGQVPLTPSHPRIPLNLAIGIAAGLGLGFAFALLREALKPEMETVS
jgi:uncharacterized protein involved in exopolysaccharide biosynthesis